MEKIFGAYFFGHPYLNRYPYQNGSTESLTHFMPLFVLFLCPPSKTENHQVAFLYPLKTSENQRFSDVFEGGHRKRTNSGMKCDIFVY